ncbi:MAG: hypothetical protein JHC26_01965 [Thermofilum sp.]|jgi:hypothetical protein|uniref:hypothetical protein n=1 Tax=Thermofilum sp. TaxID=1961369 RepID=UPI00258ACC1B|nr:hypothetical protein [Thermofilum sp.]MCI4407829.1 hypothetical protein [Thermofilum sp.]
MGQTKLYATSSGKSLDDRLEMQLRNIKSYLQDLLNDSVSESGRENISKAIRELDQFRIAAEACNEIEMARTATKAGMLINMWLLDDAYEKYDEKTFENKANHIADMLEALAHEAKRYFDEKCKQSQ